MWVESGGGVWRRRQTGGVGALGGFTLFRVLLLKYVSLHTVPGTAKVAALTLMPTAGRGVQVILASSCRYLQQSGGRRTAGYIDLVGNRELLLATLTLALAAILLLQFKGVLLLVMLSVAAAGQGGAAGGGQRRASRPKRGGAEGGWAQGGGGPNGARRRSSRAPL